MTIKRSNPRELDLSVGLSDDQFLFYIGRMGGGTPYILSTNWQQKEKEG